MSAAKRKKRSRKPAASSAGGAKLPAVLLGPGRPVLIVGVLAVVLFGAWFLVWQKVRDEVLSSDDYLVTPQKVQITPPPEWIHADVRAEVFRSAGLDGPLSIMDDGLAERIKNAFSLHPWVAKVGHVQKFPQGRVRVELAYRRPACMVDLPSGPFPVDPDGVLLPVEDFSPVEANRYPRLLGIDSVPVGTTGQGWGDARVIGGAEIADLLRDVWSEWKLSQIEPSATGIPGEYAYTLLTRGGTQIRWGLAPGSKAPGEMPAQEKLARLQNYVEQYGTLEGRDAPQQLDVRSLEAPHVSSRPEP